MENTVYYLVLNFLLPIIFLFVYLEKRARRVMISFCCGIVACLFSYWLNTFLFERFPMNSSTFSIFIAPLTEEFLKFMPILIIARIVNKGRRGSTANAYAVGIGFCLMENTAYLMAEVATAGLVWVVFRGIGTGLMHGMSATIMGIGLFHARKEEKHSLLLILCSYLIAVCYHGLFNFLVQGNALVRVVAIMMPLITHFVILMVVKKENINRFFDSLDEKTEEN